MKRILWLFLAVLLLTAGVARAQSAPELEQLLVQLWPEYDRAEMLVLLDFTLAGTGDAPQPVTFRLPANANIHAVAREMDGSLVVEEAQTREEGGWLLVTLNAIPGVGYHLEYYAPLTREGNRRSYSWAWAGTYTVNSLLVSILPPPNASDWQFQPDLQMGVGSDGATVIYSGQFGPLEAGQPFSLGLSYDKSDETLTADAQMAAAAPTAATSNVEASGSSQLADKLPLLLAGAGILLLGAGAFFYFRADEGLPHKEARSSGKKKGGKKGGKAKAKSKAKGGARYCPQCGRRAEPGDRFCRSCGARLRD